MRHLHHTRNIQYVYVREYEIMTLVTPSALPASCDGRVQGVQRLHIPRKGVAKTEHGNCRAVDMVRVTHVFGPTLRPELGSVLVVSNFIALQSFIPQSTAHPSPVAGIDIADDDFHLFCAAFALRRRTAQRFPIGASKASQHPP